MSTIATGAPPPPQRDPEGAYRFVIKHAADTISHLTWLSDGIARRDPAVAEHVRVLAEEFAGRTLECLRGWPA